MAILFVTSTRVGDAILSSGLLAHLLKRYPDDPVTVACGPPAMPLFRSLPRLERMVEMRKQPLAGHWRDLWRAASGRRWRVVVDLRRSAVRHLLRADERFGLPRDSGHTHRVPLIARTLDLPPQSPTVWTSADDAARADALLGGDDQPFVAVGPTANWPGKMWPADRFAATLDALTSLGGGLAGHRVLVSAAEGERAQAAPLLDALGADCAVDAIGADLPSTACLFSRAALFLGNDSGLMHLAAAAGCNTVGLFGPTDDRLYSPWGPQALTVRTPESYTELTARRRASDDDDACLMMGLSVETVVEAIETQLSGG